MESRLEDPADETKRLQRCVNDLVSILALRAMWAGGESSQVVSTLLDALLRMLHLDFVYVRLNDSFGEAPFEMIRGPQLRELAGGPKEVGKLVNSWLGNNPTQWPTVVRNRIGDRGISIVPLQMGLQGEIGVIVAGSQRKDFPGQTERLVLSVAANQAALGLQAARLLQEQKQVASELDRRIALRTKELVEAENNFRQIVDSIPGLVCTMSPAGEIELLNRPLMDFFGKTPEELRAWELNDAVHPDDRPRVVAAFAHSIATGTPYDIEHRCLRADGVYRWFQVRALPVRSADGSITGWYVLLIDIDDRKRAEEALQASERYLNQIINTIPALAWSARPDGSAEFFNQHYLDYVGLLQEEVRQWGWMVAVHPDDLNGLLGAWKLMMASESPEECEARLRRFDGEYRWFLFRTNPLRDESGKIVRWYGTNTDIHDRKQSEDELRRSEARKTAILDSADCIVTIDHEGRIAEFNPAAERTFGYRRDQVVGRHLADVMIPPSLRERHRQGFARYLATGEERVLGKRIELTALRADGSEFPVELSISRIHLKGPASFTGYLRDITERKRAEVELRRSEAFLTEGQRLSKTGSFSWHVATGEITWSEQVYRIFELDPNLPVTLELIGSRFHPEDILLLQDMVERAQAGKDFEYEHRLQLSENRIKFVHLVAHGVRNKDGELEYIGAAQDVTERRLSEETMSKVQSELTHMARVTSLGALTASIAHEVNQPLSGIITNASTCLRMLASDPPNIDGALETARRTIRDGNRASDVITRLRALFAKRDAATESIDLNDATREVIALSVSELQRNRVVLRQEFGEHLPPVKGDRVQLQQVILNLIRNASDSMSGVEDRQRLMLIRTERDEADFVRLTVQDRGVGIDAQDLDRLFDPFFTTKNTGMGMGLSVSRSIIESHHGRLWVTPNEGPGATFSFSIPRAPDSVADSENLGLTRTPAETGPAYHMRNS